MQRNRLVAALASAAVLIAAGAPAAVSAQTTMAPTAAPVVGPTTAPMAPNAGPGGISPVPQGVLVLDARALRARRTASGYTLTGQALVTDACQSARFDPSLLMIFPPQLNLNQFRNPKMKGVMCAQHTMWVTALPKIVTSTHPPRYVTVRTKKGVTRVTIV